MNLNKTLLSLLLFLSFLAVSIYVFKEKEVSYINKHSSLKENILEKEREAKLIEKNKILNTSNLKKDSEKKINNAQAKKKRKEKLGIKPIDENYQNVFFSIADVSEEEIQRWRVQDEEASGFALSSLVLKVNKRDLLKHEKLQIPLNKEEFLEVKRLYFDLKNEDSFVWQGSSDTELGSKASSNVLLSWYKGHLTGYLNLSKEESYQISSFKENYIIIRKLNPSFFPKEPGTCILHSSKKQNHIDSNVKEKKSLRDNSFFIENEKLVSNKNSLMYRDSFSPSFSKNVLKRASEKARAQEKIRILFLYRAHEYNSNTITSKVNAYIESLNTVFKAHSISQSAIFEKAGIEVIQENSNLLKTLSKVKINSRIDKLRHDSKADLVSILVKSPDNIACGYANDVGGDYLISAIACDFKYAFEHEIGHTLGANHERKQVRLDGLPEKSSYAYGYYNKNNKTIMAYYCWNGGKEFECNRVKEYSSSVQNFIGDSQNDVERHIKNSLSSYKVRYENWLKSKQVKITNFTSGIYKSAVGSTFTFSVKAKGTNLSYQWYQNAKPLSGKTNSTLKLTNLSSSHAGTYKVKVSDYFDSTFSNVAELIVGYLPKITRFTSGNYKKSPGSEITFSAELAETNLAYQWYKDNRALSGKTSPTLKLTKLDSSHEGTYKLQLSNDFGSIFSDIAQLQVGSSPRITTNLNSIYKGLSNATLTLSVKASGTNLSYQWYKKNVALSGKNSSSLKLTKLDSSQEGVYKVQISNDFGSIFSNIAQLKVGNIPKIIKKLKPSYKFLLGSTNALFIEARGDAILSYQWYKNNVILNGERSSSLVIKNISRYQEGVYKVQISNDFGSIFSNIAQLKVGGPPIITKNLKPSYKFLLGSKNALFVEATGDGILSYQWYKNNRVLNGETSPVLILENINSSQEGVYRVVLKSDFSTISSVAAKLTVGRIQITKNLKLIYNALSGSTITLSVQAKGDATLSYQWYKNYQPLSGQRSSSLKLTNISISQVGRYMVSVKNDFGFIFSTIAELNVGKLQITKNLNPVHRVLSGSTLTISVETAGNGTPNYQWYKDNQALTGETSSSLKLTKINRSQEGNYRVEVKNDFDKINSIISKVQIFPSNLTGNSMYLTPKNLITKTNESFILRLDTKKQNIKNYIWYRNNIYMATTSEPFYTVETGNVNQLFNYKVVVLIEGKAYFSNIATVNVIKPLTRNISSEFDLDAKGGFEFPPQKWYEELAYPTEE